MTIFRSKLSDPEGLKYQFVSANDPDIIGVEVLLDGKAIIELAMDKDGLTSLIFDRADQLLEFDLDCFRQVLEKSERELKDWRSNLLKPGGIWSEQ